MNEKGFSLTAMLVFCSILLFGFFAAMISAKKSFSNIFSDVNITDSVENINSGKLENNEIENTEDDKKIVQTASDIDYSTYEQELKDAGIKSKIRGTIKVSELVDLGYLKEIHDPKNYENICTGYVVYRNGEYYPYLKCVGSYSTKGYNLNLE